MEEEDSDQQLSAEPAFQAPQTAALKRTVLFQSLVRDNKVQQNIRKPGWWRVPCQTAPAPVARGNQQAGCRRSGVRKLAVHE